MAGHIPKDFVALLLQRIDLVSLIDARIPLRKKSAQNYFACCPFHQEQTPSFCVNQAKQFYYCFGCGAHGNAIDFLLNYERLNFVEAVESLAQQAGLPLPQEQRPTKNNINQQNLLSVMQEAEKFYTQELSNQPIAQRYLQQRGINQDTILKFNLGYAPCNDNILKHFAPNMISALIDNGLLIKQAGNSRYYQRFRDRIMFPIHDRRNRCIGFGGRILDAGEPKYLNSPDTKLFHKGKELYGLSQALSVNNKLEYMVIVEGYMDVITLFQHGITQVVATLGTATTEYQLKSLLRYTNNLVFCFDGDKAGRRAAFRALQVLWPLVPDNAVFNFMFLPEGEDPDSLVRNHGKEEFLRHMKNSETLSQYFLHTIGQDLDLSTVDGRTLYLNTALEYLNKLPEGIFKTTLLAELEHKTRTNFANLNTKTSTPKNSANKKPSLARSSTLRYAIALLLQYPQLAKYLEEPLPGTALPGVNLFNDILAQIKSEPNISTGGLLELWRDQPEAKWLGILAQHEFLVEEAGLKLEFTGAIQQIYNQIRNKDINDLLAKSAVTGLSEQERLNLITMLKNRTHLKFSNTDPETKT